MQTKYDELAADRDSFARLAARALMDGDNAAALRFAARFDKADADVHRYIEEVTQ